MKSLIEHTESLMETFDWEKVHQVMTALNWTWTNVGIPDINDMKEKVQELMSSVHGKNGYTVSSGGFMVSYYTLPNDRDTFRVLFAVTKRDTYTPRL